MSHDDPFHEGERALQQSVGLREQVAEMGRRMVRSAMPDQHRALFARLPFVLVGSVDQGGQPYASVLAGAPGFVHSQDPRALTIDALPRAPDPFAAVLEPGAAVGVLGIEPHTRRRVRMNGIVSSVHAGGFTVAVRQSFGNCPKYIQARMAVWQEAEGEQADRQERRSAFRASRLDSEQTRMIREADTFYLATAYPLQDSDQVAEHGVDASHRGGKPGFVRVERDAEGNDVLTVPDFSGNAMFATLGNIALNPRAGLLFIDYEQGDVLQLAVSAEIVFDGLELAQFEGAERLLRMRVHDVVHVRRALPLRWSAPQLSPFLEEVGEWPQK